MMLNFEPSYRVGVMSKAFKFLVLGCGGTGSMYIPRLAAYLKTVTELDYTISIFDADIVEDKNLVRQNFTVNDIGKNKATVLAAKCNTVYGTNIIAFPKYVESPEMLAELIGDGNYGSSDSVSVIVGCVDTNAVRRMIHKFIQDNPTEKIIWLDSGNEEFHGQVCCGVSGLRQTVAVKSIGDDKADAVLVTTTPLVTEYFPDMLDSTEKFVSDLSCAEHALSTPQAAITNQTAANLLMQFTTAIVTDNIRASMVTFDVQSQVFSTRRLTDSLFSQMGCKIPGTISLKYANMQKSVALTNASADERDAKNAAAAAAALGVVPIEDIAAIVAGDIAALEHAFDAVIPAGIITTE